MKHIVAVTSSTAGIAHTLLAAEALKKTAEHLNYSIQVETQGAAGIRTPLTEDDIAAADVVILASDNGIDSSRFSGKPTYETKLSEAIRNTQAVINAALTLTPDYTNAPCPFLRSKICPVKASSQPNRPLLENAWWASPHVPRASPTRLWRQRLF